MGEYVSTAAGGSYYLQTDKNPPYFVSLNQTADDNSILLANPTLAMKAKRAFSDLFQTVGDVVG
jgi:hypothetical protein